jgi:hypothetical protein
MGNSSEEKYQMGVTPLKLYKRLKLKRGTALDSEKHYTIKLL